MVSDDIVLKTWRQSYVGVAAARGKDKGSCRTAFSVAADFDYHRHRGPLKGEFFIQLEKFVCQAEAKLDEGRRQQGEVSRSMNLKEQI